MATSADWDLSRGNEETFDFLCTVCKENNKNSEAEHFCSDCQDYYCSACLKIHKQIPALKMHKILDKKQFTIRSSSQFPEVPTERCRQHGHKPVDMYCKNHDTVGCTTCMIVEHKACKETVYIPEYIMKNPGHENPQDVLKSLSTTENRLRALEKVFQEEQQSLDAKKDAAVGQIKEFRNEIKRILDELEQCTLLETENRFKFKTEKLEKGIKEIQACLSEVKSVQDNLKSAGSNKGQTFVSAKTAKLVEIRANQSIESSIVKDLQVFISFSPNTHLQNLLINAKYLGSMKEEDMTIAFPEHSDPLEKNRMPLKHHSGELHGPAEKTVIPKGFDSSTLVTKVSVRMSSDTGTSDICSMCALEDGSMILADQNNCKLKRLYPAKYMIQDSCGVPERPWQLTVINQYEVAVSCDARALIQFVSIERSMNLTRQINADMTCCGLAYANGILYVSDRYTSVYKRRLEEYDWEVLQDQSRQTSQFSDIQNLAVSSDNAKVYVADKDRGLIVLDQSGKLVKKLNSLDLQGPQSVCLYNEEGILVSGQHSKNVVQFTTDGTMVEEVLKLSQPCRAVCWHKKNATLIVGYEADQIEIHNIHKRKRNS